MYIRSLFILSGILLIQCLFFTGCQKELLPVSSESEKLYTDTGIVTDIHGNVYKTVKIGNQWWMTENLAVTVFNDSSAINIISNSRNSEWANTTTSACCLMNGENKYGYLYNWYTLNSIKKLAPVGWHIATDNDWMVLEDFLGLDSYLANDVMWRGKDIGSKLKKAYNPDNKFYWTYYGDDVYPDNTSGFSALPGGCRLPDGSWANPNLIQNTKDLAGNDVTTYYTGCVGFWWTSTQDSTNIDQAWYRYMDYKEGGVFRYYGSKNYGFSVRCVKDSE